jgi:hypothetical protein
MGIVFSHFSSPHVLPGPESPHAAKLPKSLSVPFRKPVVATLRTEFLLNRLETFVRFTTLNWRRERWSESNRDSVR